MADTGYIIRTVSGDRGPYTADQIRALVTAGKLPLTARIRAATGTRMMSVQQVVDGSAAFATVAAGTDDLSSAMEDLASPAEALPDAAPPSRAGGPRRTTRSVKRPESSSARGTGRAARTTSGSGQAASPRGTGRVTRRARPASGTGKTMGGLIGVIGVVLVIVVIKFALRSSLGPDSIPSELRGRWEPDIAATRIANNDETIESSLLTALDFGHKELGITVAGEHESGNIIVRSNNGSHFDLELPVRNGTPMMMVLDLEGSGRMRCVFAGATVILVRR